MLNGAFDPKHKDGNEEIHTLSNTQIAYYLKKFKFGSFEDLYLIFNLMVSFHFILSFHRPYRFLLHLAVFQVKNNLPFLLKQEYQSMLLTL